MRSRILLALTALALVTAACGEGATPSAEDGVVLRYAYQPGDDLSYNLDLGITADMTMSGIEEVPGNLDMTMDMSIEARTDFSIEEGPDPETVRLAIGFSVTGGSGTIEMLGATETLPFDELAGEMGSMDMEVVIDAQGQVIEMLVGGQAVPPGLLESFGGFGGTSALGSFQPSQLLGPQLPDGPIDVGSTWTEELVDDSMGIEMRSVTEYRVTAIETVAGREAYRIESTTTTDAVTLTFEDLLQLLTENMDDYAEFLGEDMSPAEIEASLGMLEAFGIEMSFEMGASTMEATAWVDGADGILVRLESGGPQQMHIEMTGIPDTGDMVIDMDMDFSVVLQLAE